MKTRQNLIINKYINIYKMNKYLTKFNLKLNKKEDEIVEVYKDLVINLIKGAINSDLIPLEECINRIKGYIEALEEEEKEGGQNEN